MPISKMRFTSLRSVILSVLQKLRLTITMLEPRRTCSLSTIEPGNAPPSRVAIPPKPNGIPLDFIFSPNFSTAPLANNSNMNFIPSSKCISLSPMCIMSMPGTSSISSIRLAASTVSSNKRVLARPSTYLMNALTSSTVLKNGSIIISAPALMTACISSFEDG